MPTRTAAPAHPRRGALRSPLAAATCARSLKMSMKATFKMSM
jgi:hypothetical protein